jgi:hypothetical protein
MKAWPNRANDPDKVARLAIMGNSPTMLDTIVRGARARGARGPHGAHGHASVLTAKDGSGEGLVHLAAKVGRPECINALAARGAKVDEANSAGLKPVHLAVQRRRERNDPRAQDQANALGALIAQGADKDALGPDGKTAAHHAALNNNTWALDKLHSAGASLTIADNRGWTPTDVAVGSTKVEAEKFFYDNGITANPPKVGPGDPSLDTIAALMRATKCENPADVAKVKAAYEQLYAMMELRPILKLLALDAMGPRDPDNGGGLRICIADDDNVGKLYAARDSLPPGGAYDDKAHVLMASSKVAGNFAGTLIHEMTHVAARLAYGNNVQPFDSASPGEYEAAIKTDVKNTALLLPGNDLEDAVKKRMSGRMSGYVAKYAGTAQTTINQEFIVGIPQLMAQYGPDEVRKLSPGMSAYFEGTFTAQCNAKAQTGKYTMARGKIDDTALAALPPPPPPSAPTWIAGAADGTADSAIKMIRDNYVAQNGKVPPGTVIHSPDQFKLDPTEATSFDAKMQRVEKAIRKTVAGEGLPPELAAEALRGLALGLGGVIKNAARPKDLDDIVAARATTWVRDAKLNFVRHCSETGKPVPDGLLAEAVVIRAENLAWMDGTPVDDGEHLAVDVDSKKHRSMIETLTQGLRGIDGSKKNNPGALLETLARPLAGDKARGFYRKGEKRIGTRDPNHVSIDVKNAKRVWLQQLATI